jgi:hypothetical protein
MGGGLMQLVAYGAQDIYLTGNPQITFFKVVYRRHTNFSMEAIKQTLNGTADYGNDVTATISRNGDLVHRMYVEFDMQKIWLTAGESKFVGPNVGNSLLSVIELEIGGQQIDKHYSHWLNTYSQLTEYNPTGVQSGLGDTGGTEPAGGTLYQRMSYNHSGKSSGSNTLTTAPDSVHVPLQFWFCRNPGLALPLIALQYHEVKVKITFGAKLDIAETAAAVGTGDLNSAALWCDYIYLDTDERRRFAQVSHEYLIEQLQFDQKTGGASMDLNFNHPVKELIWIGTPVACTSASTGPATPVALASDKVWNIKLNGHDRISERNSLYFTRTQIWQHHTGYGSVGVADCIAVYSFALKPEEHQPSGTCNFSRIDNAELYTSGTESVYIYAVNYNVLRIMSGMGGLAYSN